MMWMEGHWDPRKGERRVALRMMVRKARVAWGGEVSAQIGAGQRPLGYTYYMKGNC